MQSRWPNAGDPDKKCPATQGVPLRSDARYLISRKHLDKATDDASLVRSLYELLILRLNVGTPRPLVFRAAVM
jgi:hypothetical protein